jgi:hypothetical protein
MPAPAAKCSPSEKVQQIPTLEYNKNFQLTVDAPVTLDYLNRYGSDAFITEKIVHFTQPRIEAIRALNRNGIPEILVLLDQDRMQEYVLHNGSPLLADYVTTLP